MQTGRSRDYTLYRHVVGTHVGRPSTNIDHRAPDVLDHPRVDEPTRTESCSAMHEGITTALGALPSWLRRTLTWDQGKELALHQQITEQTGTRVFFCDAHSPWQRGSNENMNGLLRDYFAKGSDLR